MDVEIYPLICHSPVYEFFGIPGVLVVKVAFGPYTSPSAPA